ncbi:hypothetical protein KJ359_006987 [Pestalotiopsis sp. 9143b]|nr:hypothetical protein KJ359_006987 [Pestalotiopsis sp. 9143b]
MAPEVEALLTVSFERTNDRGSGITQLLLRFLFICMSFRTMIGAAARNRSDKMKKAAL